MFSTLLLQAGAAADSSALAGNLLTAVNDFTDYLLSYLGALAAVGALAMALIEGWKKIFDSRTKFHAKRFTTWVRKSIAASVITRLKSKPEPVEAIADILQLCTGVSRDEAKASAMRLEDAGGRMPMFHAFSPDPAHSIFALELERMMGAIQDAGDAALTAPQRFPALYAFMTTGGHRDDVDLWFDNAESGFTEVASVQQPGVVERQQVKDLTDATARLRQVMKRKLDGFQLFTGSRWASWNQASAIVVGYGLMFLLLFWSAGERNKALDVSEMLVLSTLGGVLSPIAKDLVASLKRVKSGG